jgi:hypothetical protein
LARGNERLARTRARLAAIACNVRVMLRLIVIAAAVAAACSPPTRSPNAVGSDASVDTPAPVGSCADSCDPLLGLTCDPDVGMCVGACAPSQLGTSYVGCEYYPVVTANMVDEVFDFAVVVANSSAVDATVTFDGGSLAAPITATVPAGRVTVQNLPWQQALKLCDTNPSDCQGVFQPTSAFAIGGSYRVRSTQPVTVYQFNPLEYTLDGTQYSYTNDASLLLPTNAWRNDYYAAAYPAAGGFPGMLAVIADSDDTHVTIDARASTPALGVVPAIGPGLPQTLTLNRGDVIELASINGDYTGSHVTSNKPVEVISGHYCTDIPLNTSACDHLEESMFPTETLGSHYVVNAPAMDPLPAGKVEVVRIIATRANTTISYDPAQPGVESLLAEPGDMIEIANNSSSFAINASAPVLVAQYMEGEQMGGGQGDPAMALAVPVEQFRSSYLFHAPINYQSTFVDVTAPLGATVMLDGTQLSFAPIGTTGYAVARAEDIDTGPNHDGNHTITGNMKFGITVYGYGQYTSYWYPGGLDLMTIIE